MDHGIARDFHRSGRSKEEFALQIGVELSRLEYWLRLAEIQVNHSWANEESTWGVLPHGTSGRSRTSTPTALERPR